MTNEIKEILDRLEKIGYYASVPKELAYMATNITPQECKAILDYITNLRTIEQQYSAILSENAELENKITNLQEENERLKQERQNIDNRNRNQKIANRKLQEEIESVRKNNRTRKSRCRKQTKKKNMYKSRNEKAIEYIKKSIDNSQPFYEYLFGDENGKVENLDKLLNILQGKSDE